MRRALDFSFACELTTLTIYRVAVGAVIAVISCVVVIFLFILLVIDAVSLILFLFRSTRRHQRDSTAPKMDMLEAGEQHQYGAYGHHPIEGGAGPEPTGRSSLTLAEEEQRMEAARAKHGEVGMNGREEPARI